MRFIEFRCPNRPGSDSDKPCYGEMAGVSINSLNSEDIVDLRYCPRCGAFWEVAIKPAEKSMTYTLIEGQIDFVEADKYFDIVSVVGRKLKK